MKDFNDHPWRFQTNESSFAYYWQKGIGTELLRGIGHVPDLANAGQYAPLLFEYDRKADEIIERIHSKKGFVEGQHLVELYLTDPAAVAENDRLLLDDFIQPMRNYSDAFDMRLLQKGVALSQRSAISGLIVLRDYCLMGGYESAAINKPLIYTGALKKGAVKRISETVEFWVNITGNDALEYGNIGFTSLVKTRLIHAFARVNILKHTDWDIQKWGYPLNTWDMLATNLGFSLVYLVGLRRMGIKVSEAEVAGIFSLWKYIGRLLGIPENILPENENDAVEALYYWTMTQANGDADSRSLAAALQEEPLYAFHPKSKFGKKMMREVHLFYNHYLLGNYSCNLLGLDNTFSGKIAYLNILRNKYDSRRLEDEAFYNQSVAKGRRLHEHIRLLYLENIKAEIGKNKG